MWEADVPCNFSTHIAWNTCDVQFDDNERMELGEIFDREKDGHPISAFAWDSAKLTV